MTENKKINLCLMTEKGLNVLMSAIDIYRSDLIKVFIGKDTSVKNDFSRDIEHLCIKHSIEYEIYKNGVKISDSSDYITVAVSWRWMLHMQESKVIVFHDSLLPQYRGFNPLVSMLINGERKIGVTAIFADQQYDTGEIIMQKSIEIDYPIVIHDAIKLINIVYTQIAEQLFRNLACAIPLVSRRQDNSLASYSLWRDSLDYNIDWNETSDRICRMIDAVGFPYQGAESQSADGLKIKVYAARTVDDVHIVNRTPGKVIFWDSEGPTIVCGSGLLKLTHYEVVRDFESGKTATLKFRTRLT